MIEQSTFHEFYPNKLGYILLRGIEEIIGPKGINDILELARLPHRINNYPPDNMEIGFPTDELSHVQNALEDLYGRLSGLGVALRSGRACFKYSLRDFDTLQANMDFRLLPLEEKLRAGATLFANLFNQYTKQIIHLSEQTDRFLWEIDSCPICLNRHAQTPICHLAVGVVQESMFWISGGKFFKVEETQCIAKGDSHCTVVAYKKALE
ncbi:MAG: 4-vinyl reductase [Omnitrophica WOR_2 bacterium]